MKKGLNIDPVALRRLAELPKHEKTACMLAVLDIHETFGRPHQHAGLGIRKVGPNVFEARGTISLRLLFQDYSDALFIRFVGTHDEVQAALRSGKYR